MTFEELQFVNRQLDLMKIRGKEYAPVTERVKAFRQLYPEGTILTELVEDLDGVCTFKASVVVGDLVLATGWAQEEQTNNGVNKTSYIENCETSAVGRALGFLGIGINTAIASAEEVDNAIKRQTIDPVKAKALTAELKAQGVPLEYVCKLYKVNSIEDFTEAQHENIINNMDKLASQYKYVKK